MEAVILAGGKGSRLQPYTHDIPKPLVSVGGVPVVEVLLNRMHKAGVTRVHLAVNHLAPMIEQTLGQGERFGLELIYWHEDTPLSTVAPIARMTGLPEHFLVANGDILTDLDLKKLYDYHMAHPAQVTVAVKHRSHPVEYGVLVLDDEQRVVGFREKPRLNFTVSMGIYVFSRSVLKLVPGERAYGFDDLMRELLDTEQPINAYPFDGYWLDIGSPEDYLQANSDITRIKSLLR
jgi:NDP-sugar pyrophosphorylase family protein